MNGQKASKNPVVQVDHGAVIEDGRHLLFFIREEDFDVASYHRDHGPSFPARKRATARAMGWPVCAS